jgi:DNA-binding CsgD family transcriptional regulator
MALKLNDFFLASNALLLIGDIHSRKGNYQKAETYLMQGLRILHGFGSFPKRKKCYSIMERYYLNTNQNKLASLYQDSLLYVNDSLERYYNQSRVSYAESEFEYQNLKEKALEEATSNKLSRFILIGILVFIVLLLFIGIQYFQRQKALANMKQMKLQLSLQDAESNLEDARAKLDAYLKKLSSQKESDVNWTESRILTQSQWKEFQVLFNDSYPGFISRLKENLPQITEGEIRFCCLMRLQLKIKEIALILGVNENSAYKNRSRLLAKLELADEKALVDILQKM